jgi:hypothetical protein
MTPRLRRSGPAALAGRVLAVAAAAVLVLAACNDDDDTTTPATLRANDTGSTVAATTVGPSTSTSTTTAAATTTVAGATVGTVSVVTASSASPPTTTPTPTTLTGSGNVVEREYPLTGFDGVDASSSFTVSITRADAFRVAIKADDNIFDRLLVDVVDGHLRIGVLPNTTLQNVHLEATVTMPELASLDASGAVDATVTGFASTVDRTFDATGASSITTAAPFAAGNLGVDAAGGSHVTLTGTATEATVQLSGGSVIDAFALTAATAGFELSGGSEASMTVTQSIDTAELSGGSNLTYKGSPTLGSIETSGGSQIHSG